MKKTPTGNWSFIRKSAKVLFVIEALCFAGSYGIWHRLNTSRDYRFYMQENFPIVLEYYYSIGETLGDRKQRDLDTIVWKAQSKKD